MGMAALGRFDGLEIDFKTAQVMKANLESAPE